MHIPSGKRKLGFYAGFMMDYIYAKEFNLEFQFKKMVDDSGKGETFCIYHTLSYEFTDDSCREMMLDTIRDIKRRDGYYYISSLVTECKFSCSISDQNVVTMEVCACCNEDVGQEVCLQLLSHDVALFTRSF